MALRGYATGAPSPAVLDVRFVPGRIWPAYGWSFTIGDGTANVGAGTFDATTRANRGELIDMLTGLFPHVGLDFDTIAGQRLPLSSGGACLSAGPVLLAGDAAGLVDPLTLGGAHTALVSGSLAGRASVTDPRTAAAHRHMIGLRLARACATFGGLPTPSDAPGHWSPSSPRPNGTRPRAGYLPNSRWERRTRGHGFGAPEPPSTTRTGEVKFDTE